MTSTPPADPNQPPTTAPTPQYVTKDDLTAMFGEFEKKLPKPAKPETKAEPGLTLEDVGAFLDKREQDRKTAQTAQHTEGRIKSLEDTVEILKKQGRKFVNSIFDF